MSERHPGREGAGEVPQSSAEGASRVEAQEDSETGPRHAPQGATQDVSGAGGPGASEIGGPGPAPSSAQPPGEPSAQEPARPVQAADLLRWCVGMLAARAWQALGLVPDPATGKLSRNLDDARLCIDAAAGLIDLLLPRATDGERRELQTLLANLRVNFVEQKERERAAAAGGAGGQAERPGTS